MLNTQPRAVVPTHYRYMVRGRHAREILCLHVEGTTIEVFRGCCLLILDSKIMLQNAAHMDQNDLSTFLVWPKQLSIMAAKGEI